MRIYASYEPLKVFSYIGALFLGAGLLISLRFLYYYATGSGYGKLQSLILAAVLLIIGFQVLLIGLLADLISGNRKILEDVQYRVRRLELGENGASGGESTAEAPEHTLVGSATRHG